MADSVCSACGKPSSLICSRCKSAKYCGVECQKNSWGTHKKTCFPPSAPPPPDNERCLVCKGWGKDLLGADQKCTHCRTASN